MIIACLSIFIAAFIGSFIGQTIINHTKDSRKKNARR